MNEPEVRAVLERMGFTFIKRPDGKYYFDPDTFYDAYEKNLKKYGSIDIFSGGN